MDTIDPDVEWDFSAYPAWTSKFGEKAARTLRFLATYRRAWTDYDVASKEVIDAGDDVVVVAHETARARGTEVLIERDLVPSGRSGEGKGIRTRVFGTKREALDAVGPRK